MLEAAEPAGGTAQPAAAAPRVAAPPAARDSVREWRWGETRDARGCTQANEGRLGEARQTAD